MNVILITEWKRENISNMEQMVSRVIEYLPDYNSAKWHYVYI